MKRFLYAAPALAFLALSPRAIGILGSLLMIAGLIFLHEMGHFLMAKWMGMPVEVFSLGFGQRLLGFRWRETDVRLSILPLGGYVKLAGYNPEEPDAEDPHGFLQQPFGKRMLFYAGGILANIATTLVLLCILGVDQSRATLHPVPSPLAVSEVLPGSPAAQAGLQAGDQIQSLDQLRFPGNTDRETTAYIQKHPGQPLSLRIDRGGKPLDLTVTPANANGVGRIGIAFGPSKVNYERRPIALRDLARGTLGGVLVTGSMGVQVLDGLWKLVSCQASFKQVGGIVTIAKAGSDAAKAGWERFLLLSAVLSMNLAILNALPIPVLDGGHMAILCAEKVRGKDFSIRMKERILTGGFVLLATLMALAIALDIWRLKH